MRLTFCCGGIGSRKNLKYLNCFGQLSILFFKWSWGSLQGYISLAICSWSWSRKISLLQRLKVNGYQVSNLNQLPVSRHWSKHMLMSQSNLFFSSRERICSCIVPFCMDAHNSKSRKKNTWYRDAESLPDMLVTIYGLL